MLIAIALCVALAVCAPGVLVAGPAGRMTLEAK